MRCRTELVLLVALICGCSPDGEFALDSGSEAEKTDLEIAYTNEDWKTCITLLRARVEENDENGRDWFRLAYALHEDNQLDAAIEANKRAAEYSGYRSTALYNWACELALKGEREAAIDKLDEAIQAGFRKRSKIEDDPELRDLWNSERFFVVMKQLQNRKQTRQAVKKNTELDFFVGEWEVVDGKGREIGSSMISSTSGGFALTEIWTDRNGNRSRSICFFDPAEKVWKQTRVTSYGAVIYYTGVVKGGEITFDGRSVNAEGQITLQRVRFNPKTDGTIDTVMSISKDDGNQWSEYFRGVYRPKEPPLGIRANSSGKTQ